MHTTYIVTFKHDKGFETIKVSLPSKFENEIPKRLIKMLDDKFSNIEVITVKRESNLHYTAIWGNEVVPSPYWGKSNFWSEKIN